MPLLEVRGVSWSPESTHARVLDNVSFAAGPGELIALMGKNGAGKSTLLDVIAGLRAASQGDVALDGRPAKELNADERARLLGHLPQSLRADVPLTVEQVVLMGRYPYADRWFESDVDRAAATAAMDACDCAAFRERRVSSLSGGERQRVFLAACLAQQPKILLLDEPATFLDIDQQLHCFDVLRREADRGMACVAVTHDINFALRFCTRILVIADGRVARDLSVTRALADTEWLQLFSSRLSATQTPDGQSWIAFR